MIVLVIISYNKIILSQYSIGSGNFADIAYELLLKQNPQNQIQAGISRLSVRDEQSGYNFHIQFKGSNGSYCFMFVYFYLFFLKGRGVSFYFLHFE